MKRFAIGRVYGVAKTLPTSRLQRFNVPNRSDAVLRCPLMFTGLVETKAAVLEIRPDGPGHVVVVDGSLVMGAGDQKRTAIGDSICINGCCLTVVEIRHNGDQVAMSFDAGEETLNRTNLGQLTTGDGVNLERALAVGDRLGGHYVTGHIDTIGKLLDRREDGPWAFLKFSISPRYARQVAGKGSIAIDGVSLTVVEAGEDWFTVALIPHTLAVTTLGDRGVGETVNLETDVLAKYVEKSLGNDPSVKGDPLVASEPSFAPEPGA